MSPVTVSVRYAHEANPLLLGDTLPTHAPQGSVVVNDGRGATCTAFVGPRDVTATGRHPARAISLSAKAVTAS